MHHDKHKARAFEPKDPDREVTVRASYAKKQTLMTMHGKAEK
jgi:hypothetical protein